MRLGIGRELDFRGRIALLASVLTMLAAMYPAGAENRTPILPPGHWVEIENSRLRDVAPSDSPGGNVANVVAAWSGGAMDTKRDRLMVWGGGHSNYAGNEVYAFDLREFRWLRLSEPSVANDSKTNLYPDGQPRSRHTYNYIEYVPSWDRLVSFGGSGPWPRGGGEFTRDISEFDLETGRWITGERTAVPKTGSMIAAIARVDPATGHVFFVPGARGEMMRLDPVSGQWRDGWETGRLAAHASGAIDPDRRLFVAVGRGNKTNDRQALLWDLRKPGKPVDLRTMTTGDSAVERAMAPGFVYHPHSKTFVAWIGGTDLYVLDPDTWHWHKLPASAENEIDPGPQSRRGTYGRFQYAPKLDAFVLVNGIDQNVLLIRPDFSAMQSASAARQGAPRIDLRVQRIPEARDDRLMVSWSAYGADHCEAGGTWQGPRGPFGSQRLEVIEPDAEYRLWCTGRNGSLETTAVDPGAHTDEVEMSVVPGTIEAGESAMIRWKASGSRGCRAVDAWYGPRASSGSERTQVLMVDSTFELHCEGSGGVARGRVTVNVTSSKASSGLAANNYDDPGPGGLGSMDLMGSAAILMLSGFAALRSERLRDQSSPI